MRLETGTNTKGDSMIQTIDTLITYGLIAVLMLAGVLASAIYEAIERKTK